MPSRTTNRVSDHRPAPRREDLVGKLSAHYRTSNIVLALAKHCYSSGWPWPLDGRTMIDRRCGRVSFNINGVVVMDSTTRHGSKRPSSKQDAKHVVSCKCQWFLRHEFYSPIPARSIAVVSLAVISWGCA
jgi:hypothetical protein